MTGSQVWTQPTLPYSFRRSPSRKLSHRWRGPQLAPKRVRGRGPLASLNLRSTSGGLPRLPKKRGSETLLAPSDGWVVSAAKEATLTCRKRSRQAPSGMWSGDIAQGDRKFYPHEETPRSSDPLHRISADPRSSCPRLDMNSQHRIRQPMRSPAHTSGGTRKRPCVSTRSAAVADLHPTRLTKSGSMLRRLARYAVARCH